MNAQSLPTASPATAISQHGLHTIYSYCDLVEFRRLFQTCHHYYRTAQQQPPLELFWPTKINRLRAAAARSPPPFLLTHITTLRVDDYDSNLAVDGLVELLVLPRLRRLIGPCEFVSQVGVIKRMKSLETIDIGWGQLGFDVDDLRRLCYAPCALTQLKEIVFRQANLMRPEHLRCLALLPTLTKLSITMPLATLPYLTAFPSLKVLTLFGDRETPESSSWDVILPLMQAHQCVLATLEELKLSDMVPFKSGELSQFLLMYPSLLKLTLENLDLPSLRGLLHLTHLSSLTIIECNLSLNFQHYCELRELPSLRRLWICESYDDDGTYQLTPDEQQQFEPPSLLIPQLNRFMYEASSYRPDSHPGKTTATVVTAQNSTNVIPASTSTFTSTFSTSAFGKSAHARQLSPQSVESWTMPKPLFARSSSFTSQDNSEEETEFEGDNEFPSSTTTKRYVNGAWVKTSTKKGGRKPRAATNGLTPTQKPLSIFGVASTISTTADPNAFTLDQPQSTANTSASCTAMSSSTVTSIDFATATVSNGNFNQFAPVIFNFSTSTTTAVSANPFESTVFSLPSTTSSSTSTSCSSVPSVAASFTPQPMPVQNFSSPISTTVLSNTVIVADAEQVTKLETEIRELEQLIKKRKENLGFNHLTDSKRFLMMNEDKHLQELQLLLTEKQNELKRLQPTTFQFTPAAAVTPSTLPGLDSSSSSTFSIPSTSTIPVAANPFFRSKVQVKRRSHQPTTTPGTGEKTTFVAGTDQDANTKSAAASSVLAAKLDSLSLMALRASVPASSKKIFQSHSLGTILYKDVMIVIFGFLPFRTAIHASRSCTQWYSAACQFKGLKANWEQMTDMQIYRLVGSPLLRSHVIKLVAPAKTTIAASMFTVSPNPLSNTSLSLIQHNLSQLEELNFRYVISWMTDDEPKIVLPPQLRILTCTFQAPFIRITKDDSGQMWTHSQIIRTRMSAAIEQIVEQGRQLHTLTLETDFVQEAEFMTRKIAKCTNRMFTLNTDALCVLGQLPQLTSFTTHSLYDHNNETYQILATIPQLLRLDTGGGERLHTINNEVTYHSYPTPLSAMQLNEFLQRGGPQTKLQSFNISKLVMTKKLLLQLAEFPQLTDVRGGAWEAIEETVIQQALKQLSSRLRYFHYAGPSSALFAVFRGLALCTDLVELAIKADHVTDSDLCEVLPRLKQLTALCLNSDELTTFRCLEISPHLLRTLRQFLIVRHTEALPLAFFNRLTSESSWPSPMVVVSHSGRRHTRSPAPLHPQPIEDWEPHHDVHGPFGGIPALAPIPPDLPNLVGNILSIEPVVPPATIAVGEPHPPSDHEDHDRYQHNKKRG